MGGKVIVIGISGTTNSGKSTLAQRLVNELSGCSRVCQDSYFLPPGDPRLSSLYIPELDHNNWEDHRALEMDKMVMDVKKLIEGGENSKGDSSVNNSMGDNTVKQSKGDNSVILFVEGYSIFTYRPLEVLFDKKYFITVDRDLCVQRRKTRNYNPPDKPGYFDQVVWPSYQAQLKQIQDQDDIVYFDGNNGVDGLFRRICEDMEQLTTIKFSNS